MADGTVVCFNDGCGINVDVKAAVIMLVVFGGGGDGVFKWWWWCIWG